MAQNIEVLPFPDWLLNTDYLLVLNDGLTEDGEHQKELLMLKVNKLHCLGRLLSKET